MKKKERKEKEKERKKESNSFRASTYSMPTVFDQESTRRKISKFIQMLVLVTS